MFEISIFNPKYRFEILMVHVVQHAAHMIHFETKISFSSLALMRFEKLFKQFIFAMLTLSFEFDVAEHDIVDSRANPK